MLRFCSNSRARFVVINHTRVHTTALGNTLARCSSLTISPLFPFLPSPQLLFSMPRTTFSSSLVRHFSFPELISSSRRSSRPRRLFLYPGRYQKQHPCPPLSCFHCLVLIVPGSPCLSPLSHPRGHPCLRRPQRHRLSRPPHQVTRFLSSQPISSFSRGYRYVCCALSMMHDHPELDLHVCFKQAYDQVLRHHHPLVVRSLVAVRLLSPPPTPLILLRSPSALLLPATTFACASPREQTSPSSTSPSPSGQQRSTS